MNGPLRAAAFVSLLASAACGPHWTVVRQAVPDPFVGKPQFTVEKVRFDGLRVGDKTETEYLSGKDDEQRRSWQTDKDAMSEAFAVGVASGEGLSVGLPRPDAATVRPIVTFIEPGFYAGVAAGSTRVDVTVQVLNAQGVVLDEIQASSAVAASMTNPASGTRMREAAEDLGRITADYLHKRVTNE